MKFKKLLLLFPTLSFGTVPIASLTACSYPELKQKITDLEKQLKDTNDAKKEEVKAKENAKNDKIKVETDLNELKRIMPLSRTLLINLGIYEPTYITSKLEVKITTASLTNKDSLDELLVPSISDSEITADAFLRSTLTLTEEAEAKSPVAATYIKTVLGITPDANNKFKRADLKKIKLVFQPAQTFFDLEAPIGTPQTQKITMAAVPIAKLAWKKVVANVTTTIEIAEPVTMKTGLTLGQLNNKNIEDIAVKLLASSSTAATMTIANIQAINTAKKEYAIGNTISNGTETIMLEKSLEIIKLEKLLALFDLKLQPEVKIELFGSNNVKKTDASAIIAVDDYLRLTFTLKGTSDKKIIIRSEAFK